MNNNNDLGRSADAAGLLPTVEPASSLDGSATAVPIANGPLLWDRILSQMPRGAIIAGGAVRDYLLGVEPNDIDVFFAVEQWPQNGFPGFERLGADRDNEYANLPTIAVVQRGRLEGYQVDVVGVWMEEGFDAEPFVDTFDVGISRSWYDTGGLVDFPEASADREAMTVTLLVGDREQRSRSRFERFNAKHGGLYRFVVPAQGIEAPSGAETTKIGSAEGESPVAKPCAQTQSEPPNE